MERPGTRAGRLYFIRPHGCCVKAFVRLMSPVIDPVYMVGVAQLAEHQVVVLGVAGSNPVTHPSV
jgi:hypothetical protein